MRDILDEADDARDEARERPNRAQLILNAKRLRAEIAQFIGDVRYWNRSPDVDHMFIPSVLIDAETELGEWLDDVNGATVTT